MSVPTCLVTPRRAVGNVIIVRYADDLIIGFELDKDARRFQEATVTSLIDFLSDQHIRHFSDGGTLYCLQSPAREQGTPLAIAPGDARYDTP